MAQTGGTAYQRLGGRAIVVLAVERLYERVLADPALAPYFETTSVPAQRDKLAAVLIEGLGGPRSPFATRMVEAHTGRGISDEEFDLMVRHLLEVLRGLDVPDREVKQVARWLSSSRASVVDAARR